MSGFIVILILFGAIWLLFVLPARRRRSAHSSMQDSVEVRFASSFELTLADGSTRRIDPTAHEQLAPLLTLVGRALLQLVVSRSGDLEIRLSDGSVIEMRTRATRASFEVNGAGALEGMSYVSGGASGPLW